MQQIHLFPLVKLRGVNGSETSMCIVKLFDLMKTQEETNSVPSAAQGSLLSAQPLPWGSFRGKMGTGICPFWLVFAYCFTGKMGFESLGLGFRNKKWEWEACQYMTKHTYFTLCNNLKVRHRIVKTPKTYSETKPPHCTNVHQVIK